MKVFLCYSKGKEVIQFYIDEILSEGITHIPMWKDPNEKESESVCDSHENADQPSTSQTTASLLKPEEAARRRTGSTGSHSSLELGATAATIQETSGSPGKGTRSRF